MHYMLARRIKMHRKYDVTMQSCFSFIAAVLESSLYKATNDPWDLASRSGSINLTYYHCLHIYTTYTWPYTWDKNHLNHKIYNSWIISWIEYFHASIHFRWLIQNTLELLIHHNHQLLFIKLSQVMAHHIKVLLNPAVLELCHVVTIGLCVLAGSILAKAWSSIAT